MQKQAKVLLQKKMSRKEFLAMVGFGIASLTGIFKITEFISSSGNSNSRKNGYGSSPYGR